MLNAVAERALNLCDAAQSGIFLVDGDKLRFAAGFGSMSTFGEGERSLDSRAGRRSRDDRSQTIHHADIVPLLDTEYPMPGRTQRKFGFARSWRSR